MSRSILYAEDDDNDVFLMQRAFRLAELGGMLQVVPHGQAALDYINGTGSYADRRQYPLPTLVIVDLKMPGLTGFDVLEGLRRNPATRGLPVLVITSSNQESDIERAYASGANAYLLKPGRPDDLLALVKGIRDFWLNRHLVRTTNTI